MTATGKGEGTLGLNLQLNCSSEDDGKHPRLNQCFLCKAWQLEKNLFPIDIPDQGAAWVEKKCCQSCLDKLQLSAGPD